MKDIKFIGFDLDQTLYPKSTKIDEAIQSYIYKKIAEFKGCEIEEAKSLFYSHYPKLSGRKTLIALGIPNAADVVQEALEKADLSQFLVPDIRVHRLLEDLGKKFSLSLITGSSKEVTKMKLVKLQIDESTFEIIITGEVSKSDGTAYRQWIAKLQKDNGAILPSNLLYVGDRPSTDAEVPLSLGIASVLVNVTKKSGT